MLLARPRGPLLLDALLALAASVAAGRHLLCALTPSCRRDQHKDKAAFSPRVRLRSLSHPIGKRPLPLKRRILSGGSTICMHDPGRGCISTAGAQRRTRTRSRVRREGAASWPWPRAIEGTCSHRSHRERGDQMTFRWGRSARTQRRAVERRTREQQQHEELASRGPIAMADSSDVGLLDMSVTNIRIQRVRIGRAV